ncbi:MAG: ATP-binding protein [Thermoanaerobaculia bacterium]
MTLARRVVLLVVLLHVPLAGLAGFAAGTSATGLVAAELAVLLSLAVSWRLLRLGGAARQLARGGRELLAEGDFATRFRLFGQRDVDDLVQLFNSLSEELQRERLRLEERDLLLGKLVAASPAGVVMLDLDSRVDLVNPAAARLMTSGLASGLLASDASGFVGKLVEALPSPFGEVAAALTPGDVRVLSLGNGRRARLSRAEFQDRGFERTFLLIEEMTVELRASERAAYEKVIRLVSHEVNNSAGAVSSILDSSREILRATGAAGAGAAPRGGAGDDGEVDHALDVAARRVRHLAAFVDGFAEVVRIPEPNLQSLDLGAILSDLVTLHRPEAERRSLRLTLDLPATSYAALADREQIEQALLNLLRNAFEATPDGGLVEITLLPADRSVAVQVADSGHGLTIDAAAQIFTPFFSTKRDGRGLGLTLVQEIAQRHGGEITLENGRTAGAVARLTLPGLPGSRPH